MEALTSSACTEKVQIAENVYYSSRYHIFAQSSLKIICTPLSHYSLHHYMVRVNLNRNSRNSNRTNVYREKSSNTGIWYTRKYATVEKEFNFLTFHFVLITTKNIVVFLLYNEHCSCYAYSLYHPRQRSMSAAGDVSLFTTRLSPVRSLVFVTTMYNWSPWSMW